MDYCSLCSVFISSGAVSASTTPAATIIISGVVAAVSVATLCIGYATYKTAHSQMKIASARVRLDLYNKRFNIYVLALEYYQTYYNKLNGDLRLKGAEFIKHYRESLFLFSEEDGIYETLTNFKNCMGPIEAYRDRVSENSGMLKGGPNADDAHEQCVTAGLKMGEYLSQLEKQMVKYLDFKVVDGW